jgi:protein TonB
MFENSLVYARSRTLDRRFGWLSLSIAIHTAAIAAVIAASVASTSFPSQAPKEVQIPILLPIMSLPPALGTPHPAPRKSVPAAPKTQELPRPDAAPLAIPANIQPAAAAPATDTAPHDGPVDDIGVPWGSKIGVRPDGPPSSDIGPLPVGGDVKAPTAIRRVTPDYPRIALQARKGGWVLLKCIIDKSGHIRDAQVIASSFAAFEPPAMEAVQQWLFAPGTLNGQPVDVIFELKVTFEVR